MKLKWRGVVGFGLVIAAGLFVWARFFPGSFMASNVILGVTGLAIIWYTIETNRLAQLTKKHIEIEIRPLMVIMQSPPQLRIQNVGRSPALHVRVKPVVRGAVRLEFPERLLCTPKDGYDLRPSVYKDGTVISGSSESEQIWKETLTCVGKGAEYEIEIRYCDMEGDYWSSRYQVSEQGVHLKGFGRATNPGSQWHSHELNRREQIVGRGSDHP